MIVNQFKSVPAWSEPSTWMGVQWLVMIEGHLHALKERENSLLEGRDIYRLQILAGSTNASNVVVHLKLCLVLCSCYWVCSSLSHSFLRGNYHSWKLFFFHLKVQLQKEFNKLKQVLCFSNNLLFSISLFLAWTKLCIHWGTSMVMHSPNLSYLIQSTLSWSMRRR